MRTSAVILAAGAGTRLGGVAKALLAGKDGRSFLRHVVETAKDVGTEDVIVVVGPPHGEAVARHARELSCGVVINAHPERGMASSVALGFAALHGAESAWLWPVDHPQVQAATLRGLISALMNHDAARPVYQGRGGHPPLIARSLFDRLASCAGVEGGARSMLAAADTIDVPVDDAGVVRDVDVPRDLEGL